MGGLTARSGALEPKPLRIEIRQRRIVTIGECFWCGRNRNGFWRMQGSQPNECQPEVGCGGGSFVDHTHASCRFKREGGARCRSSHAAHGHVGNTGEIRGTVSAGGSPCRTAILRRFERARQRGVADGEQTSADQHYGKQPSKHGQGQDRAQGPLLSSTNPPEESTSECSTASQFSHSCCPCVAMGKSTLPAALAESAASGPVVASRVDPARLRTGLLLLLRP